MQRNDVLELIGIALFVAGCAALVYGLWLVAAALAWIVGGTIGIGTSALVVATANRGAE